MEDWGTINLIQIDADNFWSLYDEMLDDDGFVYNRAVILDAFKNGKLYGLRVIETDKMFGRGAYMDYLFCANAWYVLPCLCVKEGDTILYIWTHKRARNNGFAKKLVELLGVNRVYNPSTESRGFFDKLNITHTNTM